MGVTIGLRSLGLRRLLLLLLLLLGQLIWHCHLSVPEAIITAVYIRIAIIRSSDRC